MVTYKEQILSQELPERIIIAGAGAIGVEFAYVLHNYGAKVTLVEYADRVVPAEDADISKELARHYRKLGIEILTSTRVDSPRPLGLRLGRASYASALPPGGRDV